MKTMTTVAFCLATLVAGTSAQAADLTTYPGVEGRYTVNLGRNGGQTVFSTGYPSGLFDYANHVSGWTSTWTMNDGDPGTGWDTFGGRSPDFFGYRFKLRANTVTSLFFANRTYGDGGTFAAAPDVQYLTGPQGEWVSIPAANITWDTPYNNTYDAGTHPYNLTFSPVLQNVWGIRLIGDPMPGADDTGLAGGFGLPGSGFVGVGELTVYGELDLDEIDLHRNLALNKTPYMSHFSPWSGPPEKLTDGDLTGAVDTYGARGDDALGVLWDQPQYQVRALGVMLNQYSDGGVFSDACTYPFRIEYTTDGSTWMEVTGLDKGRYTDEWTSIARWYFNPQVAWLFTFDELNGITGLRIIGKGTPRGSDTDGFVGAFEIEVFGKPLISQACDLDNDGDVDGLDLSLFMNASETVFCVSGPTIPADPACLARDLDDDGDVDQVDFGIFQKCYSGSGIPYDPFCGQ